MRKLVQRFSVELDDGRTNEEVHRRLRVLSQPLYRYANAEEKIVDGALFAVAEATDPEVWIIMEATHRIDRDVWQYGVARMNMWPMKVQLDGKLVQTWEKLAWPLAHRGTPYTLCPFSPRVAVTAGVLVVAHVKHHHGAFRNVGFFLVRSADRHGEGRQVEGPIWLQSFSQCAGYGQFLRSVRARAEITFTI